MSAVLDKRNRAEYDTDFHAWVLDQVRLLRAAELQALDIEHLIEELEGLSASEQRELISRLRELLMHLLKWCYQPDKRTRSWEASIALQRDDIDLLLEKSPSLRARLTEFAEQAYPRARRAAARETGLVIATFPETCEWTLEQVLDIDWLPQ